MKRSSFLNLLSFNGDNSIRSVFPNEYKITISNHFETTRTSTTNNSHLPFYIKNKAIQYPKMKLSTASFLLVLGTAYSFAPSTTTITQQSTRLNLFGGGSKSGEKKGPGMMDQLAMFKKAQEIAKKKNKLDQELAAMDFSGTGADGKVKASFKFMPITNPMDPNPDYEAVSFEFDEEWFEGASPDDISAAVKEAIDAGIKMTNEAVVEKYQSLQGDLAGALAPQAGADDAEASS